MDSKALTWFAVFALFFGVAGIIVFGALIIYYSTRKDDKGNPVGIPTWTYIFLGISILIAVIGILALVMAQRRKHKIMETTKVTTGYTTPTGMSEPF